MVVAIRSTETMLRPTVSWGQAVSPNQSVADVLAPEPELAVTLPGGQPGDLPAGAAVTIDAGSGWHARLGPATQPPQGGVSYQLIPANGTSICGAECGKVPLEGTTSFSCAIDVIPEQAGVVVPVSALAVLPDGTKVVTRPSGDQVTVTVTAAANGMAVVAGIPAGTIVLLAATAPKS